MQKAIGENPERAKPQKCRKFAEEMARKKTEIQKKYAFLKLTSYLAQDSCKNAAREHAKYRQVAPDTVRRASGAGAGQSPTVSGSTFGVHPAPTPDKVQAPQDRVRRRFFGPCPAPVFQAFRGPHKRLGPCPAPLFGPCPAPLFSTRSGASFSSFFRGPRKRPRPVTCHGGAPGHVTGGLGTRHGTAPPVVSTSRISHK